MRGNADNLECAFCGSDEGVELHHIVPKRYGGSNSDVNMLEACNHCHKVLERTYDARFYDRIGARVDMTPNMMFDLIKEQGKMLDEIYSALGTKKQIMKLKRGDYMPNAQQSIDDYGGVSEVDVKIDLIDELLNGGGPSDFSPKIPTSSDVEDIGSYRDFVMEEFEKERRPHRRGEAYSQNTP